MHFLHLATLAVVAAPAAAWPGMKASGGANHAARSYHAGHGDMVRDLAKAASQGRSEDAASPLLGDLARLADSELTSIGRLAKRILLGQESAVHVRQPGLDVDLDVGLDVSLEADVNGKKVKVGNGHSASSASATASATAPPSSPSSPSSSLPSSPSGCGIWRQIADEDLVPAFTESDGSCSSLARGAIRLGFHDAAAWEATLSYGGADGSILLAPDADELDRSDNNGLQPIANQTRLWFSKWSSQGVGMADLIQFSALVATVTCPLGPRIRFLAGRTDSSTAPPTGLLPSAFDSAPDLISLFEKKTISARELVALVGAHTVSRQFFTDAATAGDSQDSTPGVWDTLFYNETTEAAAPDGVYRFPSDIALSQYGETSGAWRVFSSSRGQGAWNRAYANAYFRMSLLGVQNINSLTDCSSSIP